MSGELSEKPVQQATRTSSGDMSSDDNSVNKHKSEGHQAATADTATATKPDPKVVKVDVVEDDPFKHLPPHEAEILRRQLHIPTVKVGFSTLYRYATTYDKLIMAVSAICAIGGGAALPLMTVIFGKLAGFFQAFFQGTLSEHEFTHHLDHFVLYFIYLAIGEFITIYIATVGFIYTGEHISSKIRAAYLAATLRQNIGFYDKLGSGRLQQDSDCKQPA